MAFRTIHSDPNWWKRVLIGGALMSTLFGYPFVTGFEVESLDNTRKGFPTPLPPWADMGTRYIIGLFASLIDFLYYFVPLFIAAFLLICVGIGSVVSNNTNIMTLYGSISQVVLFIIIVGSFVFSVSPIGRLIYVDEGAPERAMSFETIREGLRLAALPTYLKARIISLPAYIPALILGGLLVWVVPSDIPFSLIWILLLIWLTFSALVYAHLIVLQIYAGAEQVLRERGIERQPYDDE